MKRKNHLLWGVAFAGSAIMATGCKDPLAEITKAAKEQQITVDPNPLELHGDQVTFTMKAKLPVKMMKKGTKYSLELAYTPGDIDTKADLQPFGADDQKVGAVSFDGDQYAGSTTDPQVTKEFSFGYQDKYEMGGLLVKGIASKVGKDKTREFGPVRLKVQDGRFVKGISTTSRLVKSPIDGINPTTGESPFAYAQHGYAGPKDEFLEIPLFFQRGSAAVSRDFGSNKMTMETIATLFKDTKVPAFEATGSSSHSPEGSEAVNTSLAENRAKSLEMEFAKMLNLFKYSKEEISAYKFNFDKKVLGETVPEFEQLVNNSSLTPEQKTEAKEILAASGDFVNNERKLQTKPYYTTLMEQVYPQMRYAKTQIKKPGAAKSAAEMSALTKKIAAGNEKPEVLTEQEYLYAAENTPDLQERVNILMTGAKAYPNSWKIYNNAGAAYLDMALLMNDKSKADNAIQALDKSMAARQTGDAAYNLAMAYAMKGDKAKMEENLTKAANLGSDNPAVTKLINGAKGYMAIKAAKKRDDGNYKNAETILSDAANNNPNLFNKGLAQLLQGVNYDAAIASFNSAAQKNPKDAITFYAMAIAYSRKGDESNMSANLKKACELSSALKGKALKDVEFDRYKNSNSFKDAIK